jgi:hypothetical protein
MKQEVPSGMAPIPRGKVLAQLPKKFFASGEHLAHGRHRVVRDIGDISSYINCELDTDP